MTNCLVKSLMKREGLTKEEAISLILEEYDECGMDAEECLYHLGYEPDYVFQLFDIVGLY